jgi:hypothetical protein
LTKSRRRIAHPKAEDYADFQLGLQQGFAIGGMGFRGQFALQQSQAVHVRFGSKADIGLAAVMSALPPKARTSFTAAEMSALCQEETNGTAAKCRFIQSPRQLEERGWNS